MDDELKMKRARGVDAVISAVLEEIKTRLNKELSREEPGGVASEEVLATLHELVVFLDQLGRVSTDAGRQLELVLELEEGVRRGSGQHHVEIVVRTNGEGRFLAGLRRLGADAAADEDWTARTGWESSISEAVDVLARKSLHTYRPIAALFDKLDKLT